MHISSGPWVLSSWGQRDSHSNLYNYFHPAADGYLHPCTFAYSDGYPHADFYTCNDSDAYQHANGYVYSRADRHHRHANASPSDAHSCSTPPCPW